MMKYLTLALISFIISLLFTIIAKFSSLNKELIFVITFVVNSTVYILFLRGIIKKRIDFVYKNSSLFDSNIFNLKKRSTDLNKLIEGLHQYTESKKKEIDVLSDRENFRREFIANLSHELKTPIFVVQGYIYSALEDLKNENVNKEFISLHLDKIDKTLDRLSKIINGMDTISNIESGIYSLNFTKVDLIEIIKNVFDELEILASKKNIKLQFDRYYSEAMMVFVDKEKMKQVIYNIVSNAIHYGRNNGEVVVVIKNIDDVYRIHIKDDGVGIGSEDLSRIFERFYRAEKTKYNNVAGVGLGMSIVKRLLDLHRQPISINSELGKGTEVIFTLNKAT